MTLHHHSTVNYSPKSQSDQQDDDHSSHHHWETPVQEENISEKRIRITRACDYCRKRRVKCSGTNPCSVCVSQGLECTFATSTKKRGPPSQSDMLKILENRIEVLTQALVKHLPESETTLNDYTRIIESYDPSLASISSNHNSVRSLLSSKTTMDSQKITVTVENGVHRSKRQRSTMAPKVDEITILQDASDRLQYLGTTSSLDSRILKENPLYKNGVLYIPMTNRDRRTLVDVPDTISQQNPCSRELLVHLSSVYFNTIHLYLPMIDEADFYAKLSCDQHHLDDFTFLLNAMITLVTQSIEHLDDWHIPNTYLLHLEFVKRTRSLMANQIDRSTIYNIQAFILISLCGLAGIEQFDFWVYIGIAVRLCQEQGMHRNLSKINYKIQLNPRNSIVLRKTWFTVCMLDRVCSLLFGRPMMIRDEEVDLHNLKFDDPFMQADLNYCQAMDSALGMLTILGHISAIGNAVSIENRVSKIDQVSEELEKWMKSCPAEVQKIIIADNPDEITWCAVHLLAMYYHISRILLEKLKHGGSVDVTDSFLALVKIMEKIPSGSLRSGVYHSPLIIYIGNIVATYWALDINTKSSWPFLKKTLDAMSKTEPFFQVSFQSRLLILEYLASQKIDPIEVLGPDLANAYPISNQPDVHSRYHLFFREVAEHMRRPTSHGKSPSLRLKIRGPWNDDHVNVGQSHHHVNHAACTPHNPVHSPLFRMNNSNFSSGQSSSVATPNSKDLCNHVHNLFDDNRHAEHPNTDINNNNNIYRNNFIDIHDQRHSYHDHQQSQELPASSAYHVRHLSQDTIEPSADNMMNNHERRSIIPLPMNDLDPDSFTTNMLFDSWISELFKTKQ